jgi:hypothetical protein
LSLLRRWTVTTRSSTVEDRPLIDRSIHSFDRRVTESGPSTSTPAGVRRCLKPQTGHWSSRTVPGHGGETQSMPPPFIAETASLPTTSSRWGRFALRPLWQSCPSDHRRTAVEEEDQNRCCPP